MALKIEVNGLPEGYDALYVICYNRQMGRLENVPVTLGSEAMPLASSNKKSRAIQQGLIAEAIRLRAEHPSSFRKIYDLLKIKTVIGWTEGHFRRLVTAEIQKNK